MAGWRPSIPSYAAPFVKFPWARLYEYPLSIANIAIEREYRGEKGVFLARIKDPARLSLLQIHELLRTWKDIPIEENKEFRRVLWMSRIPWPIRPILWWFGLNIGRQRGNFFGTFTVSVYSGLGAESLHPLTPTATTLNYGIIEPDGSVNVRIIYDHRVMDGATVARVLKDLEGEMRRNPRGIEDPTRDEATRRLSPFSSFLPKTRAALLDGMTNNMQLNSCAPNRQTNPLHGNRIIMLRRELVHAGASIKFR